ncbi:DNA-binding protein [Streptomyces caatingaensis]|uniref:DNA-binding protein n=2 Tax=Streptomyces caatingaensis TaxID=1678637 RepID=A0A0K9XF51_9ACTN|nr:DNA-binding protein [Streptomyces caatingaensis]
MASTTADRGHRRALAAFLRSRRERLLPSDVGLPAGPRRRTPGLRREEVALLSGVSVTWYTWLEQARGIGVSRQVLHGLARALLLSPAETRHLFSLAGEAPPDGNPPEPPREAGPALRRLVDALDPHPAYVVSPTWDLLAWNRAEAGLIGDPARRPGPGPNLLRRVFLDPATRALLVDWPGQARMLLEQYRAAADRHAGDADFARLTGELLAGSAEFARWWHTHDIAEFRPVRREFDHPRLGRLSFDYVKLAELDTPGVTLVSCLPADGATARRLPELSALGAPCGG